MRHGIYCILIAIVVSISVNGVAMAANELQHQTHCLQSPEEADKHHASAHGADHDGTANHHATPGHDHETCMMHACPALSADSPGVITLADVLLAHLSWPDRPLISLGITDGLKRPPKV